MLLNKVLTVIAQIYVGGIQLLSEAGATWAIVPQVGDLTHVDAGFSTSLGGFASKWLINDDASHTEIYTPEGTTGTVGLPLPGKYTSATLTGTDLKGGVVEADESGRHWIEGLAGGDHVFTVVGDGQLRQRRCPRLRRLM